MSQDLGGFVEQIDHRFFNKSAGDGWPGVMARYNHDDLLGTTAAESLRLSLDDTAEALGDVLLEVGEDDHVVVLERLLRDRRLVQVADEVAEDLLLNPVGADGADRLVGLVVEQERCPAQAGEPADGRAEAIVELRGRDRPMVLAEQLDEDVDRLIARGRGWG